MPENPQIVTLRTWAPSTFVLWAIFLLSIGSLVLPIYLRFNVASIFVAVIVATAWIAIGRRWFSNGFHQAYDMLCMFACLASLVALVISLYRLWA